jgi:hypothetical protein
LIIIYHEDDKTGAQFAAVLYEKGFDNVYLLSGGIEDFYQKKPDFVVGSELPPLQSELDKLKVVEQKPKIRKTKEELIMENEMMFQKKKTEPFSIRAGSTGLSKTATDYRGFQKPQLKLDPSKIKTNSKFDDIPDVALATQTKLMPPKPKGIKQLGKKEVKEEKPLTDKLTNIAINTKTMTSYNVERKIDKIHAEVKEVTQKPNFGRYQPPQGPQSTPYL